MKPEKRTKRTRSIIAYHFVSDKLRNGREIPADGELLTHPGTLKLCESGLHASKHPFDALGYAPGSTLCIVRCSGTIVEGDNKLVCSERKIIARFKADELLWKFARQQAMTCIDKWDAPNVVKDYLTTGGKSLRSAAESAAWSAAESAAWSAVWSAAESAARSAAWGAVWSVARSAAESAARSAAWGAAESVAESAARSAAWGAAESAAVSAAWGAAENAAWSAAESAAESAARKMFLKMVREEFKIRKAGTK